MGQAKKRGSLEDRIREAQDKRRSDNRKLQIACRWFLDAHVSGIAGFPKPQIDSKGAWVTAAEQIGGILWLLDCMQKVDSDLFGPRARKLTIEDLELSGHHDADAKAAELLKSGALEISELALRERSNIGEPGV